MHIPIPIDIPGGDLIGQVQVLRHFGRKIAEDGAIHEIGHAHPEQERNDYPAHMTVSRRVWIYRLRSDHRNTTCVGLRTVPGQSS